MQPINLAIQTVRLSYSAEPCQCPCWRIRSLYAPVNRAKCWARMVLRSGFPKPLDADAKFPLSDRHRIGIEHSSRTPKVLGFRYQRLPIEGRCADKLARRHIHHSPRYEARRMMDLLRLTLDKGFISACSKTQFGRWHYGGGVFGEVFGVAAGRVGEPSPLPIGSAESQHARRSRYNNRQRHIDR